MEKYCSLIALKISVTSVGSLTSGILDILFQWIYVVYTFWFLEAINGDMMGPIFRTRQASM